MTPSNDRSTGGMTGRVIRAFGKTFVVLADGREYLCEVLARVKQDKHETPVAVGDIVDFQLVSAAAGAIEAVQSRRSKFSRPRVGLEASEQVIVANVDQMVIVVSAAQPSFKQHLIDRFSVAAFKGGLRPVVVINKIDLEHKVDLSRMKTIYQSVGMPLVTTSCVDNLGAEELRALLADRESIFVGHSGTGKSSLLNLIQPGLKIRTGEVSRATNKGIHTTTNVELYPLHGGGFVADTPGLKILGIWDLERDELQEHFPEFEAFRDRCRFRRCSHLHEPECAVQQAVTEGVIFLERYSSYRQIYESLPR